MLGSELLRDTPPSLWDTNLPKMKAHSEKTHPSTPLQRVTSKELVRDRLSLRPNVKGKLKSRSGADSEEQVSSTSPPKYHHKNLRGMCTERNSNKQTSNLAPLWTRLSLCLSPPKRKVCSFPDINNIYLGVCILHMTSSS